MLDWIQPFESHYFAVKLLVSLYNGSLFKYLAACSSAAVIAALIRRLVYSKMILQESADAV
jgi:hypothetical protein